MLSIDIIGYRYLRRLTQQPGWLIIEN